MILMYFPVVRSVTTASGSVGAAKIGSAVPKRPWFWSTRKVIEILRGLFSNPDVKYTFREKIDLIRNVYKMNEANRYKDPDRSDDCDKAQVSTLGYEDPERPDDYHKTQASTSSVIGQKENFLGKFSVQQEGSSDGCSGASIDDQFLSQAGLAELIPLRS